MFANILRTQARLALLTTVRVARPTTRSLSALASSRTLTVSRIIASRAFSQSAVTLFGGNPRNPPSESLFIGNLPWSATQEDISEVLADFGTISDVRIPTHADGRPRGFAHVTFTDKANAVAAMNSALEEPLHLAGRDLVVDFATARRTDNFVAQPNNKLYFANFKKDEDALRQVFSEFADDIQSIFFMRDGNTGEVLSTGFIEFPDQQIATEVLNALNNAELEGGESLRLSYARPRKERAERGSERDGNKRGGHYHKRDWSPRN